MDTEVMERTPPLNTVVISDLSTEGLVMAYIFIPNYLREPEGGIVAAARAELVKRGVITDIVGTRYVDWNLDEDVREELAEVWIVDRMPQVFRSMTKAPRKRK
jgi:hypothetical protein